MTDRILRSIYYNQKHQASYSSPVRLYEAVKDKGISLEEVKKWLSGELTYTLHRPLRKNFKRNKILVSHIDEQWEADLVDMREFASRNNGNNYILTIIDCFSKYAFVRPLKVKSGLQLTKALKDVMVHRKPSSLRTDKGKEFINDTLQKYLKTERINYFTSNDSRIKCAIVERLNRTLKGRMFKYFTANGTRRYIDVLQDFVTAYNKSYHRSIKMRPIDVNRNNERIVFKNIYKQNSIQEILASKRKIKNKISTGDKVRRTYDIKAFDKGYYPNWTDEIYTVEKTIKGDKQIVFRIKDYSGNIIEQRFYPEELQKITEDLHRIEKIIKTRKRRGKKEYFIKWLNYPESYNSWVSEKEIKNVKGVLSRFDIVFCTGGDNFHRYLRKSHKLNLQVGKSTTLDCYIDQHIRILTTEP